MKNLGAYKIQNLTLNFTSQNEEVDGNVKLDDRFGMVEKIQIISNLYDAPALLQTFGVNGDNSIIDPGTHIGIFQTIEKEPVIVELPILGNRLFAVKLIDDTQGAFVSYFVQFILYLK